MAPRPPGAVVHKQALWEEDWRPAQRVWNGKAPRFFVRHCVRHGRGWLVKWNDNTTCEMEKGEVKDDPVAMAWSPGVTVSTADAGFNSSFINVALRVLPADSPTPTHAAMGWQVPDWQPKNASQCGGGMTFAVFPIA